MSALETRTTRGFREWASRNSTNLLRIVIVLLFLGLAVWAITLNRYDLVIANREPWLWLTVALVSVGPELAGIVIGVVTIDYLNERRQDELLKKQLILQLSSKHDDVADTALKAITARGWLHDGSLRRVKLWGANLRKTDLREVDLSGFRLKDADLSGANLIHTNLSGAFLIGADLRTARLSGANLSRALLIRADLRAAHLFKADLSGAWLGGANLSGADLKQAKLNGASLEGANLRKAKGWTIEQLEQARGWEGAIMPNGQQLSQEETEYQERIEGPTFDEWKYRYLAERKGTNYW